MRKDEKKLIKRIVIVVSAALVAIISFACYLHYKKYHFIDRGRLIAKVNGTKIYEKDIETRLSAIMSYYDLDDLRIDNLTDEEIKATLLEAYLDTKINKLAKKIKLNRDNDLKFLAREYYERLIREKYLQEKIFNNITEEEIRKRYDDLVDNLNGKEERKISHIVVETEDEANRIRSLILAKRNSFEDLAEKKSLDTESAKNGGCIGYVLKEEIAIQEFAEIAFMLKVGEMSRPVQTSEGWHIIRVEDSRKIVIRPYEGAREEILEKIITERFHEFMEKITKNPKIELFIKIREDDAESSSTTEEEPENENHMDDSIEENIENKEKNSTNTNSIKKLQENKEDI